MACRGPIAVLVHGKADELLVENGLQVQRLFQVLIRLDKHILDLLEDLYVVHRPRRIGVVEGLLDAQVLPLLRIVLGAAHEPAFVNVEAGPRAHGDHPVVETREKHGMDLRMEVGRTHTHNQQRVNLLKVAVIVQEAQQQLSQRALVLRLERLLQVLVHVDFGEVAGGLQETDSL